jgi:hypothetical protein
LEDVYFDIPEMSSWGVLSVSNAIPPAGSTALCPREDVNITRGVGGLESKSGMSSLSSSAWPM